jgi:hypothetical protein
VAARAKVSRATTYRYFPEPQRARHRRRRRSLGPVRAFASNEADGRARVHELFVQTFPRFTEFEPQMRAAAQLALEQWALERAGLLEEEPYRRGHRVRILEHALAPARQDAAARDPRPAAPGPLGRLRHRAVHGPEGHLGRARPRGGKNCLVDGRCPHRCGATRCCRDEEAPRSRHGRAIGASDAGASEASAGMKAPGLGEPGAVAAGQASPEWFDAQYNNRARIPEHLDILREWDERSHHARASLACTLDVAYGSAASERLDVFAPRAPGAPVLVYVHGGYWRALDKRDQSFVAVPFVAPARWSCCRTTRSARRCASRTSSCSWCNRSPGSGATRPSTAATGRASSSPAIPRAATWRR